VTVLLAFDAESELVDEPPLFLPDAARLAIPDGPARLRSLRTKGPISAGDPYREIRARGQDAGPAPPDRAVPSARHAGQACGVYYADLRWAAERAKMPSLRQRDQFRGVVLLRRRLRCSARRRRQRFPSV